MHGRYRVSAALQPLFFFFSLLFSDRGYLRSDMREKEKEREKGRFIFDVYIYIFFFLDR